MLMGAEIASLGNEVRMLVSDPEIWNQRIDVYDQFDKVVCSGVLAMVTSDDADAITGADVVLVTYPTFLLGDAARRMLPCISKGQMIGVIPGNDAEFFFSEHVRRGAVLFGLQRVHCVARTRERGKSVFRLGNHRKLLHVAALPASKTADAAGIVESLLRIPTAKLPSYLVETLTPSNPILHTTRIRTMFDGWELGKTYNHNILFYEEWDMASSERLLAADDELQRVCRALENELGCDLSGVRSLKLHYESPDAASMTKKISSIPAFKGLTSPMKEMAPGLWAPDFSSRYFHADFAFGLKAIKDIAALANVRVPVIDDAYGWYIRTASPLDVLNGVPDTLGELVKMYM